MSGKRKIKFNHRCVVCKNEFQSKSNYSKYCSRYCARRISYLKEYKPHPRKPFLINCSYCGKEIRKAPSSLKNSKSKKLYCNKSCKAKLEMKKEKVKCYCHNCGKEMSRNPSQVTRNVFCSERCHGLFLRQFTKEKSFNWKGGYKKDERTLIRNRKFWKELRQEILSLFQGTCAICKKEGELHIHHIVPWRLGGEDKKENLIPLCPKCHSQQTVKDWEYEHGLDWKTFGAHTNKEVM